MLSILRASAIGTAILLLTGCPRGSDRSETTPEGLQRVTVQLDWVPEPQHGGLYQAVAKGYFAEQGLDVTILSGGANVAVLESVALGNADIGQSATTQVISAAARGLPLVCIASVFHQLPTSLLMHEDNPVQDFPDLDGKTIMGRPEALYIPYIRQKYGINFNVVPQNFGLGMLINDPSFIQEGYYIAEPYYTRKEGVELKYLKLSDAGYQVYALLFANKRFLEQRPEVAQAFVRAYIRGWQDYLENDPEPAHALIRKARRGQVEDAFLDFGRSMITQENLGRGDPALGETYGSLDPERIAREIAMLEQLGAIPANKVSVGQVLYTPSPKEQP